MMDMAIEPCLLMYWWQEDAVKQKVSLVEWHQLRFAAFLSEHL